MSILPDTNPRTVTPGIETHPDELQVPPPSVKISPVVIAQRVEAAEGQQDDPRS